MCIEPQLLLNSNWNPNWNWNLNSDLTSNSHTIFNRSEFVWFPSLDKRRQRSWRRSAIGAALTVIVVVFIVAISICLCCSLLRYRSDCRSSTRRDVVRCLRIACTERLLLLLLLLLLPLLLLGGCSALQIAAAKTWPIQFEFCVQAL